jgi:hypothetical protein
MSDILVWQAISPQAALEAYGQVVYQTVFSFPRSPEIIAAGSEKYKKHVFLDIGRFYIDKSSSCDKIRAEKEQIFFLEGIF